MAKDGRKKGGKMTIGGDQGIRCGCGEVVPSKDYATHCREKHGTR